MNTKRDILLRAIDANAFKTTDANDGTIQLNPTVWQRKLKDYAEAKLILAKLGESHDFRGEGQDYVVTVDAAPTASAATAETAATSVTALTYTQVTYLPTEYSKAYQVSDKQMRRPFFSLMENISKKLGYAYGIAIEDKAAAVLVAGTGSTIYSGTATTTATIAAADTFSVGEITEALEVLELADYDGYAIVTNPYSLHQLRDVIEARDTGAGDGMLTTGFKGTIMGMGVYKSSRLPTLAGTLVTTVGQSFVFGSSIMGQRPYGVAYKRDPVIRTDYIALDRITNYVATGEFDVQVEQAPGIVLIEHVAVA